MAVESVLENDSVCLPHGNVAYKDALVGTHATVAAKLAALSDALAAPPAAGEYAWRQGVRLLMLLHNVRRCQTQ